MRKVNIEQNQALIDLCLNCERTNCPAERGCSEYRKMAAEITEKQDFGKNTFAMLPATPEPEPDHNVDSEKDLLMHFNTAIDELTIIMKSESMDMSIPAEAVRTCITQLKKARSKAYEHLIDWNAVASAMGGKHGS